MKSSCLSKKMILAAGALAASLLPLSPSALAGATDEKLLFTQSESFYNSYLKRADSAANLFIANGDGSEMKPITWYPGELGDAALSPDGKWVAFYLRTTGNWNLYVMKSDGSARRLILADTSSDNIAALEGLYWHADSQTVSALVSYMDNTFKLADVAIDGSGIVVARSVTFPASRHAGALFSPDRTKMAFVGTTTAHAADINGDGIPDCNASVYALFVTDLDGKNVREITRSPELWSLDAKAKWSPDGKQIAFAAYRPVAVQASGRTCYDPSQGTAESGIYLANLETADLRQLLKAPADIIDQVVNAWNPAGNQLAVQTQTPQQAALRLISPSGENKGTLFSSTEGAVPFLQSWRVAAPASSAIPLTVKAKNGDRLAYAMALKNSVSGNAQVYTAKLDGTDSKALTTRDNVAAKQPAWSPDGASLAYISFWDKSGLFVMSGDGSGQRQITFGNDPTDPAWSPDGSLIVYADIVEDSSAVRQIFTVKADGSARRQITSEAKRFMETPSWSPDGKYVVFRSVTLDGERGAGDGIYVASLNGGAATLIAEGGYHPSWHPDGTQIVFSAPCRTATLCPGTPKTDSNELFVVPAQGGLRKQITRNGNALYPSWSPNGSKILFSAPGTVEQSLWTANADGSQAVQLGINAEMAAWQPLATASVTRDDDHVFNWAEKAWAEHFAPAAASQSLAGYYFRHYPGTRSYLATYQDDGFLYYLGPLSDNQVFKVGPLADWLKQAKDAGF